MSWFSRAARTKVDAREALDLSGGNPGMVIS